MDHVDVAGYDLKAGNTSRSIPLKYQENEINNLNVPDPDDEDANDSYDMSKNKYLFIFNHFEFERSSEFGNKKPKDRIGTHYDVHILENTFRNLDFVVKTHNDLSHRQIIKVIEKFINLGHKDTSCIAFAILTHGSYDGYLFANDQPYELKEITQMLEHQKLVLIPKLLFLQISMVMDTTPQHPIRRRMNSWGSTAKRWSNSILTSVLYTCSQSQGSNATRSSADAAIAYRACRGQALDKGHEVEVDGLIPALIHVPSHIDFLILHSSADGFASFRCDAEGSWMIQSLCQVIRKYHRNHDILHLITLVNRRVAFDRVAYNSKYPSLNNKKQSLEARYTLTKLLRL